ncbi:MAG: hypothetical protein ACRD1T_17370, partial [Acidimicrobiia bacterium]
SGHAVRLVGGQEGPFGLAGGRRFRAPVLRESADQAVSGRSRAEPDDERCAGAGAEVDVAAFVLASGHGPVPALLGWPRNDFPYESCSTHSISVAAGRECR